MNRSIMMAVAGGVGVGACSRPTRRPSGPQFANVQDLDGTPDLIATETHCHVVGRLRQELKESFCSLQEGGNDAGFHRVPADGDDP